MNVSMQETPDGSGRRMEELRRHSSPWLSPFYLQT